VTRNKSQASKYARVTLYVKLSDGRRQSKESRHTSEKGKN